MACIRQPTESAPGMFRRLLAFLGLLAIGSGCAGLEVTRASTGWVEVRTENVLLRTDLTERRARDFAVMAQATHDALAGAVLGCAFEEEQPRPIEVTVVASETRFDEMFGRGVGGRFLSGGWDDDFEHRVVLRVGDSTATRQVFQHELAHVLVHRCFPSSPHWLDEGIASFLETAVVRDGAVSIGIPTFLFTDEPGPRRFEARGALIKGIPRRSYVPPTALFSIPEGEFFGDSDATSGPVATARAAHYATAWAVVHALELDRTALHDAYTAYLDALRHGEDSDAAWRREFAGVDLDGFVAEHVVRASYDYFDVAYEPVARRPPSVRAIEPTEAHLELARLWASEGGEEHSRKAHAHASSALADPRTRARARLLIAADHVRRGRESTAVDEVRAGLEADPDDRDLLRVSIRLLIETEVARNREAIRAAVTRLDAVASTGRDFAAVAYGLLFLGELDLALVQSTEAVSRDPDGAANHLIRAYVLANLGRFPEALGEVDRAIARSSHGSLGLARLLALREELRARDSSPR